MSALAIRFASLRSSWQWAALRSCWGPRGISKTVHLWLPVAALLHMAHGGDLGPAMRIILQCLTAAFCFGQVTILANDLTDQRVDRAAGKSRWITALPRSRAWALIIALAVIGLVLLVPGDTHTASPMIYLFAIAVGLC